MKGKVRALELKYPISSPLMNSTPSKILHKKAFSLTQTKPLFVSAKCHGNHKTVTKLRRIWPPPTMGTLPNLKQW